MYRGFNLSLETVFDRNIDAGKRIEQQSITATKDALTPFLAKDGVLDGTKVQQHWFPQLQAEVFISHSHRDSRQAIGLAGWLYETFNLVSFIDSCVWGYSDTLLKHIDNEYCLNEDRKTYDYMRRNGSTSHVHMMLATALQMMMDSCECVVFLNTPSSISSRNAVDKTYSPWLYMELALTRLIRRKTTRYHRGLAKIAEAGRRLKEEAEMRVEYEVDFTGLSDINDPILDSWRKRFEKTGGYSLDSLYQLVPMREPIRRL